MNLEESIQEFIDQEGIHLEGERGIEGICKIVRAIGYKDSMYQLQISRDACTENK